MEGHDCQCRQVWHLIMMLITSFHFVHSLMGKLNCHDAGSMTLYEQCTRFLQYASRTKLKLANMISHKNKSSVDFWCCSNLLCALQLYFEHTASAHTQRQQGGFELDLYMLTCYQISTHSTVILCQPFQVRLLSPLLPHICQLQCWGGSWGNQQSQLMSKSCLQLSNFHAHHQFISVRTQWPSAQKFDMQLCWGDWGWLTNCTCMETQPCRRCRVLGD